MGQIILSYHGKPDTQPNEGEADHMKKWKEWSQGPRDSVVDLGRSAGASMTLSKNVATDGGGAN